MLIQEFPRALRKSPPHLDFEMTLIRETIG